MKHRILIAITLLLLAVTTSARSFLYKPASSGSSMTVLAGEFLGTLSKQQRATVLLAYDSPKRVGWHFIPKKHRKGLQIREMDKKQRKVAHALLRSSLSAMGYDKARQIMQLEAVLAKLEGDTSRFKRDTERYYFTLFGEPNAKERWGLSIEGHHLSFNYVVEQGKIISSTPQFLAANPATVMKDYIPEVKKGTRVLALEEQLGFDLVNSFSGEQAKVAVIAEKAPKEIRTAGEPQPPTTAPVGLPMSKLDSKQVKLLRKLVQEYAGAMPAEVAQERLAAIESAGYEKVHFAWAGAKKPGIGHYYRVQGPTFLIEFVNTQPDPAGNLANHIHCVWHDMAGDFALPIK